MGKGCGGIGKFLGNKPWHPSTYANQKAVWLAEQKEAEEVRLTAERREQLQREREDNEMRDRISRAQGGSGQSRDEAKKIEFLYSAPPGLKRGADDEPGDGGGGGSMDAAAIAFEERRTRAAKKAKRTAAFSASGAQSTLEDMNFNKYSNEPSRAEQIERFPELAGARDPASEPFDERQRATPTRDAPPSPRRNDDRGIARADARELRDRSIRVRAIRRERARSDGEAVGEPTVRAPPPTETSRRLLRRARAVSCFGVSGPWKGATRMASR